jgi:MFS transporter, ACS family, tartrate transporter
MEDDLDRLTMRRVSIRILPFVLLLYLFSQIDRYNVGMAALQMNKELNFGAYAYGLGAGIFFLGYALFDVPSNLLLVRVGARRWFARIAITWGLVASAMMFVHTTKQFYAMRFLLGLAEAGLVPGVIYYLSRWFPQSYRARAIAVLFLAVPLGQIVGAPLGGAFLGLNGIAHISGWQWLFLIEGLPPIALGIVVLYCLPDSPENASWLSREQRDRLLERLCGETQRIAPNVSLFRLFTDPKIWALSAVMFAYWTVGQGYSLWAPTLVRESLGTTNSQTGLVVGAISLVTLLIYPLSARFSDRRDDRCAVAALGFLVAGAGYVATALLPHSALRVLALVPIQMLGPIFITSFFCLPTKFLKDTSAAAGIAMITTIGSTGGFFGPTIVGFAKQTTGSYSGAFYFLAGLALAAGISLIALRRLAVFGPQPQVTDAPRLAQSA